MSPLSSKRQIPLEIFVYSVLPGYGLCVTASTPKVPSDTSPLRWPMDAGPGACNVTLVEEPPSVVFSRLEKSLKRDEYGREYTHGQFAIIKFSDYPSLQGNLWSILKELSPVPNFDKVQSSEAQAIYLDKLDNAPALLEKSLAQFQSKQQAVLSLIQGICAMGRVVVTKFEQDAERRVRLMEVLRLLLPKPVRPQLSFTTGRSSRYADRLSVQFGPPVENYPWVDWRNAELQLSGQWPLESYQHAQLYAQLLEYLMRRHETKDLLKWLDRATLPGDFALGNENAAQQLLAALAKAIPTDVRKRSGIVTEDLLRATVRATGDMTLYAEYASTRDEAKGLLQQLIEGSRSITDFRASWDNPKIQKTIHRFLPRTAALCDELGRPRHFLEGERVQESLRRVWPEINYDVGIMALFMLRLLAWDCPQCLDDSVLGSIATGSSPEHGRLLSALVAALKQRATELSPRVTSKAGQLAASVGDLGAASSLLAMAVLREGDDPAIQADLSRYLRDSDGTQRIQTANHILTGVQRSGLPKEEQLEQVLPIIRRFEWREAQATLENEVELLLESLVSEALGSSRPALSLEIWRRKAQASRLAVLYQRVFEKAAQRLVADQSVDWVRSLITYLRESRCMEEAGLLASHLRGRHGLEPLGQRLIEAFDELDESAPGRYGKSGWWEQLPEPQLSRIKKRCQFVVEKTKPSRPYYEQFYRDESARRAGLKRFIAPLSIVFNVLFLMCNVIFLTKLVLSPPGEPTPPITPLGKETMSIVTKITPSATPEEEEAVFVSPGPFPTTTPLPTPIASPLQGWPEEPIVWGDLDSSASIAWNATVSKLVSYGKDGIVVYDVDGRQSEDIQTDPKCKQVTGWAWGRSNDTMVWGCDSGEVFGRLQGEELITTTLTETIDAIYLPRKDDEAILIGESGQVYSWTLKTEGDMLLPTRLSLALDGKVLDLTWQMDQFAAFSSNGKLYTWKEDRRHFDSITLSETPSVPGRAAWSWQGDHIAWIDQDGHVFVKLGGAEEKPILEARVQAKALAWKPGGEYLFVGTRDGYIVVWQSNFPGAEPQEVEVSKGVAILSLACSRDGRFLAAIDGNGKIYRGELFQSQAN